MAEAKESTSSAGSADSGGGSSKIMMGILGLNMVALIVVAVVLFLGQKRQAQQQDLNQVAVGAAEGAPGEHGGAAAPAGGGGEHGGGGAAAPAAASGDTHFFNVGDFTANLNGTDASHYVKVVVNFEMSKDADEEELKQRKPQFRDRIISLLNSKKPGDLQSTDGRNNLKEEIKTVSNTFLKKGKVEGVYFSAFVVN